MVNDQMLHSSTNYECYKGLFSSFNSMNMFEINHSLLRQFGPENWCLYRGKHLLSFVDNHDVTRIASNLTNEKHLPLIYALCFGMPGIPCVYYGSEWGAKANKSEGDPALRACFDAPQWNELSEWIARLSEAKKESKALNYGDFRSVVLTNKQCIFERKCEDERVLVAINADGEDYTAHFDAGCGTAVDLISGEPHDFGGGSVLPAYSAYFWKMVMGVSTVTVSKALSDQKGVSEELRVKIKEKAEEMGYKTTSVRYRERQASAKSYTFGVIVSDRFLAKYESFYWNLYQEVATAAVGKGCFTMLEVLKAEDEDQLVMPRLLGEKKAEGLIIIGSLRENYMDRLIEQLDLPFILLDFTDRNGVYDAVISNSYMGMYRMTNYLFDMGHRQIGFVGNVFFTGSITDRFFGYLKSLAEHGVELNREWVLQDRNGQTGRSDEGFSWKLPKKLPTAFVCNNDVAAANLVEHLQQEGFRGPQDISGVGYDNYQPPGLCDVRITTYEVDMPRMAQEAVGNLIGKLSGVGYKEGVIIVDGRIIYKESVSKFTI